MEQRKSTGKESTTGTGYEEERTGPDSQDSHYFNINDMVKLKHHGKTKFEYEWTGPYFIVELGPPGTYYLTKPNGLRLDSTTHQNDLAPWISQTQNNVSFL